VSPKRADPAPGPRPAHELDRYDRLASQPGEPGPVGAADGAKDPLGVLAEVRGRDGEQLSATQTWQRALADADHLAVLHAVWAAETTQAREQRYAMLLAARGTPLGRQPGA
jgi:hypothetical protein